MGQDEGEERARALDDDRDKSPEQLRSEIEDVRQDLGDTAAALGAKTDVKGRARARADELKASVTSKKDELLARKNNGESAGSSSGGAGAAVSRLKLTARENPVPTAAAAALLAGFVLGRIGAGDR